MSVQHRLKMHLRVVTKRFLKYNLAVASNLLPGGADSSARVRVLMYHRVNSFRKNELSITPGEFRKQVAWLKGAGFGNMRMSDLENRSPDDAFDKPRVIFTFDDGYEDNYLEAFPILKDFGYTATFYIPVAYIETDKMTPRDIRESNRPEHNKRMSWRQIEEMSKAGMEIGSHTIDHATLTALPPEEAWRQISESKRMLEEKLGTTVSSFCYPGGYYDESHVAMVGKAGYRTACTASPRRSASDGSLRIARLAVLRSDSFYIFRRKMNAGTGWFSRVR